MSSILIRMMTVPIIGSIDAHTTSENHGTAEDMGIGMIALMSRGEVGDRVSVGRVTRTAFLLIKIPAGVSLSLTFSLYFFSMPETALFFKSLNIGMIIALSRT
jgi:hypothetical protein